MTDARSHEKAKTRVAIFGGAFDPIHNGHLATIAALLAGQQVDKVVVIPSGDRPDKAINVDGATRLELTRIAVAEAFPGDPRVEVSDLHVEKRVGYGTIDLVDFFLKEGVEPYVVIGQELVGDLPRWKDAARLCSIATFLIIKRLGVSEVMLPEGVKGAALVSPYDAKVLVSSTTLRQMLKEGASCAGLMPATIAALCQTRGLYR